MKTLSEYIEYVIESRIFTLTEDERNSVCEIIGFLIGNIGDDSQIKQYSEYWNVLSNSEQEQMIDLYDVFDDKHAWPKINSRIIKDDIPLLLNFLNWCDEKELIDDKLYDVIEKLEQ